MKVTISNYGDLDPNGKYQVTLTGMCYYREGCWIWETVSGSDVYVNNEQHKELLIKLKEWSESR